MMFVFLFSFKKEAPLVGAVNDMLSYLAALAYLSAIFIIISSSSSSIFIIIFLFLLLFNVYAT